MNGVVGSDLLEGLATGNGFHGYTGLELGTVGSALPLRGRLRLGSTPAEKAAPTVGNPVEGRFPASEVNDGTYPEKPDHRTQPPSQPESARAWSAFWRWTARNHQNRIT